MHAREPDSQQQGPGRGCGAAPGTGPDGDAAVLTERMTRGNAALRSETLKEREGEFSFLLSVHKRVHPGMSLAFPTE